MRFLHTADWHLGQSLSGRSRISEQEEVLLEILEIARSEEIDCLLIAGDIYHSQLPSPEAERLAFHFFSELIGNKIPAVIIGGNHDHPKRLAALRQLVEQLQLFIRPEPAAPETGGVIDFQTKGERAKIAVLPFVTERKIVDAVRLMDPEHEAYADYEERVAGMLQALSSEFTKDTVNILTAHLYIRGAESSGSERAIHISQPYEVSAQRLPSDANYIALGHIHRPQELAAPSPTLYCGSILQMDFGEQGQDKRVVIVDAAAGKPATWKEVLLSGGRRLRDLSITLEDLEKGEVDVGDDFLRVTVRVSEPVAGIAEQVRAILPNAIHVSLDYPKQEKSEETVDLAQLGPEALFSRYYEATYETEPSEQLKSLFRELYEEVTGAAN